MQSPHYRKIELQSNADLNYLYANAIALSRQKLVEVYPPLETDNEDNPDPVKSRVQELVEEFIRHTYTLASDSITINGVDINTANQGENQTGPLPFDSAFSAPETIEYEPYDGALASRVSSLYAQLESLTTTVAQLRREAPRKAAKTYADALTEILKDEDADFESLVKKQQDLDYPGQNQDDDDDANDPPSTKLEDSTDEAVKVGSIEKKIKPEWKLEIPFGSESERERWQSGEMAEVYSDTLRTLLRLQGEYVEGDEQAGMEASGNAISTTIGTAERASRAAEVVQKM